MLWRRQEDAAHKEWEGRQFRGKGGRRESLARLSGSGRFRGLSLQRTGRGMGPPPPSMRTALLLGRLPELWAPAAAGAEVEAQVGVEVGAGEEAEAEAQLGVEVGGGEKAEAEVMAVQGPVDRPSSLSSGLGSAGCGSRVG